MFNPGIVYLLIGELVLVDTSYGVVVLVLFDGDLVGDAVEILLTGEALLAVVVLLGDLVGDVRGLDELIPDVLLCLIPPFLKVSV